MLRCMRTTLTLEDDVAALVGRVRRSRNASLTDVVNEALRLGLTQMETPPIRWRPYRTPSVSLGKSVVGHVVNVSEALALAEGESFR